MVALYLCPPDSSRQPIALERISIPAMSRRIAPCCGPALGPAAALPDRSSKLVLPPLPCTKSSASPERVRRSTTTRFESKGHSASAIFACSTRAKILLLLGSDRDTLPTATPMPGKKLSPRLPSIASVRPVLSLTAATISGLYLLGSKVAATMAITITITISTTIPTAASSRVLKIFMPALRFLFVGDAERHMPGRDVAARRLDVAALVVEKNVRAEGFQERALVQPAQKQGFVDADVPGAQRAHDAFVGGRAARRHQRGADGRAVRREFGLDAMQRRQKTLERASRQRLLGRSDLARGEGVQAVPLVDALGLVGEEHGIAVEGDAQTLRRLDALPDVERQDRRGRMPRV